MTNWQAAFVERHIEIAAKRYGADRKEIVKIGGFENLVYALDGQEGNAILRVSHNSHRSEEQFLAELNFIAYLVEHGVNVCRPLPSLSGNLLEAVEAEEGAFILTAFERAQGGHAGIDHPNWGPALFEEWGAITGQMHALAKTYEPPAGTPRRETFDGLPDLGEPADYAHKEDAFIEKRLLHEKFNACEREIANLPKTADSYGLSHRDLHHGNFHVHNGRIIAFDFDDCGNDYFIHDVAMAVYYATIFPTWKDPVRDIDRASEFANRFLSYFMTGYERFNQMDSYAMKQLPLFIEKRRVDLAYILYEQWGAEQANKEKQDWLRRNVESVKRGEPCMRLQI